MNRNNPHFVLLPTNNDRTAWQKFGFPIILVVPNQRTPSGLSIRNSSVFDVRIYVEDRVSRAAVAGHDNIGKTYPTRELYIEQVSELELLKRRIDISENDFYDSNGEPLSSTEVSSRTKFRLRSRSGVVADLQYYPDADYYDLSDILLDLELLPSARYNLVYEAKYYSRVLSENELQELICINPDLELSAKLVLSFNHPGEIIQEFYNLTPPPYLTGSKSTDTTLALYRPFTDSLQDIYDEQVLLKKLNWVFDAQPEVVPYLSSLLGWELPYFPKSLDKYRRAVLRRTTEFQSMAGSKQAIINIFRLFGFEILISNLWVSSDGSKLIRLSEPTLGTDETVVSESLFQMDLVYAGPGEAFLRLEVPLLFRPQTLTDIVDTFAIVDGGSLTLEAVLVDKGSESDVLIRTLTDAIIDAPDAFGDQEANCLVDNDGYIISQYIDELLADADLEGRVRLLLDNTELTANIIRPNSERLTGNSPLNGRSVWFDRESNKINITTNGFVSPDHSLYIFVYYRKQQLIVPEEIRDQQSNRFEIKVLTKASEEFVDPVSLEFAIEFLNRLKAMHSILHLIRNKIDLNETYEVTDWCVGGDYKMRFDTDAGKLQVPPAILPIMPDSFDNCSILGPASLGYKKSDIQLRLRKLSNLVEEFLAWDALKGRATNGTNGLVLQPDEDGNYLLYGQAKVTAERIEDRSTLPTSEGSFNNEYTEARVLQNDENEDFCYKGRVDDQFAFRSIISDSEHYRSKQCSIGMGIGVYYIFPSISKTIIEGVANPEPNSKTQKERYSGGAKELSTREFSDGKFGGYLKTRYDQPTPSSFENKLGRLYRSYGVPASQTIHYHNRRENPGLNQRHNLALERPSLQVEKPTMHLPGCSFLVMNGLEEDFFHDYWDARPWDDAYSRICGPQGLCNPDPDFLNARIVSGPSGDTLEFDESQFSILGNGLKPKLSNYGGGADTTAPNDTDIIHSVLSSAPQSDYVILDQTDHTVTKTFLVTMPGDEGKFGNVGPVFKSYDYCEDGLVDFVDGYPASGSINQQPHNLNLYEKLVEDWWAVLQYTAYPRQTAAGEYNCTYGSGELLQASGLRYDCGCLIADCYITPEDIVKTGLILHFDPSNSESYDGSETLVDLSSGNNNGTLLNGVEFSEDGGGSLVFDGVDDYVDTTLSYSGPDKPISMIVWMKAPAEPQLCGLFGFRGSFSTSPTAQNQLYISGNQGSGIVGFGCAFDDWRRDGSTFESFRSVYGLDETICDDEWHYVVITRSSTSTRLYIDNVLIDENSSGSITNLTSDIFFRLGGAGDGAGMLGGYYYKGKIGLSLVYNRALSIEEVRDNYEVTKERFGFPVELPDSGCSISQYLDGDHYDWEPDNTAIKQTALLVESIGVSTLLFDGKAKFFDFN